jgi:hypothetical protein
MDRIMSRETVVALGEGRRLVSLGDLVDVLGGPEAAGKMAYAPRVAVASWIKLGHVPRERAMLAAKGWGIPVLLIHDPWVGSPDAAGVMTYDETMRFLIQEDIA